ncbi:MAG: hypothetical protein JWP25_8947 [Bradyrhizobium sp.]|nr:hypothetical protein [Bradyrhizobium sp.]
MAANSFEQLVQSWNAPLRKAFLDAVYALRDQAQIDLIAARLEAGDVDGALRAVGLDPVAFRQFDQSILNAFEAGGNFTSASLPIIQQDDGFRVKFQFNVRNPAAERWLSEHSSTLITDIMDDQRAMIRAFLMDGMAQGDNPRTTALDLVGRISAATGKREGGVIGLTSSQREWVDNYEAELTSDNPQQALSRVLRDARFDRAVMKAAESGDPIPADLLDKMVVSYRNRALRYRAEVISRSESLTALHESQQQAMEQAVDSGAISRTNIKFAWRTAGDLRVRDAHSEMEGQEVAMGEMFIDGDGNELEYPGDPMAPIETTAQCRCWREPVVSFLEGIS